MTTPFRLPLTLVWLLVGLSVLTGCSRIYYSAWETLGKHKRDLLVDRVEDARNEQEQAKEQFASALDHFQAVVGFQGGDLEARYRELADELERSEERAEAVREEIDAVRNVAQALFDEWEDELDQYTSEELRRQSAQQLRQTLARYNQLMDAMERVEAKMDPVLTVFRDQVLFLKHNLNAQAIASLQTTAAELDADVESLIRDMQQAIDEANRFLEGLEE